MKKVLFAVLVLSLFAGCGKGKYSDIKEYVDGVIACIENHSEKILQANTGEEIAAEIRRYGDEMLKFAKMDKALHDKYPELRDYDRVPKRVKNQMLRLETAINSLAEKVSPHLEPFMDDEAVLQANIELMEKFNNIDFENDVEF